MNALQVFKNPSFGQLTVIIESGKELFKLEDVAWALGYTKEAKGNHYLRWERINNILKKLDISTVVRDGQQYIDESGLYDFIFESGTEKAREFRKWVTAEILPTIRKHGAYMTPEKIEEVLLNPDTIIKLATELKTEREKRIAAEKKVELQKPKILFADAVETSKSSILVGELAKLLRQNGIDIGQNRLFEWLRENGYLIRQRGENYNLPTQYSMDLGLFEIKKHTINNPDGSVRVTRTPKVTGKGQIYFINKFLNYQERKVY